MWLLMMGDVKQQHLCQKRGQKIDVFLSILIKASMALFFSTCAPL